MGKVELKVGEYSKVYWKPSQKSQIEFFTRIVT